MKPLTFGVIGIGGYAQTHISLINDLSKKGIACLSVCLIRTPEKYIDAINDLKKQGVKIYNSISEISKKEKVDIITIPTGIEQHEELSVLAMKSGFHVICEKPAAGSTAEVLRMKEASLKYNKKLAIGYQHIFSPSIQKIKRITINGELGALKKVKSIALLIRTQNYFKRNLWAGKISFNGKIINDSPTQNMTGHFLNNMLYVSGNTLNESAEPVSVLGENFRVNPIECADTQYIKVKCENGIEIYFYTSIAADQIIEPFIEFIYENGKINWQAKENGKTTVYEKTNNEYKITAVFDNGNTSIKELVFSDTITAINENREPLSNIHNSIQHTICVEKSFNSSGGVKIIPPVFAQKTSITDETGIDDSYYAVKNLSGIVKNLYEKELGFSEKFLKGISK